MQEKETKYKGGIMAFVPSHSSAARFPNLCSKATKWDSVRCPALCAARAFPDGGRLGKTVQMIATMAMNMPGPDENNRTSLVVVPAALLHQVTSMLPDDARLLLIQQFVQWYDELESKTNSIFSVHIHHGKTKLKSLSALRERDVLPFPSCGWPISYPWRA